MNKHEFRQETFNKVATHVATQGHRSANNAGLCRYRKPNGDKCSIGHILPDEYYDSKMEGRGILILITMLPGPCPFKNLWSKEVNFLDSLQAVHDMKNNWKNSNKMKLALKDIAQMYNLDNSIVDKLDWSNFPH